MSGYPGPPPPPNPLRAGLGLPSPEPPRGGGSGKGARATPAHTFPHPCASTFQQRDSLATSKSPATRTVHRPSHFVQLFASWTMGPVLGGGWRVGAVRTSHPLRCKQQQKGRTLRGRDVLEGGEGGGSEGGGGGGWLGPPSSWGPPMVPAEGGPKNFKLKSSWRQSKILAVSPKHLEEEEEGGGGGVRGGTPPPPTVYGCSNTWLLRGKPFSTGLRSGRCAARFLSQDWFSDCHFDKRRNPPKPGLKRHPGGPAFGVCGRAASSPAGTRGVGHSATGMDIMGGGPPPQPPPR